MVGAVSHFDLHLVAADAAAEARSLVALLDRAHAAGYAIPPKVAEAAETIAALAVAWGHNANGRPAPAEVRKALGLPPVAAPDPLQRTIEEVSNE